MSSVAQTAISYRQIYGINANVPDNIAFTDEDTCAYIAGHNIVQYNRTDKRQRFLQLNEVVDTVTAFHSGCGKRIAAVAERGEKPLVHIYDLRTYRRKKTISTDSVSKEFISVQLSEDDNLLLTLTSGPDWTLACWNWSKAKIIASIPVGDHQHSLFTKCSFNPIDTTVACVIGKESVKFYRIVEKEMRLLHDHNFKEHNFTSLCWLRQPEDHVIVGTDDGQLLVFQSGEYLFHIPSPSQITTITSLASFGNGFVCGTGFGGLSFFQYEYTVEMTSLEPSTLKLTKSLSTDLTLGQVSAMAINPADDAICAVTSDGQLLSLPLSSPANLTSEMITNTVAPFHMSKAVIGLDTCTAKPLVATCAKDNTLRLWNIQTHNLDLLKTFPEEMFSLALHPSGLQVAIGFSDKLRIYHILVDDLRQCLEIPVKGCRECRFSQGGHLLAMACGKLILIINFHTGERLADLKGHNGNVHSLHWLPSGHQLMSCGQDGAIFFWEIDGARHEYEFVLKGTSYTCVTNAGEAVIAVGVGKDRILQELALPDLSPVKSNDCGVLLSQVAISVAKNVMLAGVGEYGKPGFLRSYYYPLNLDFEEHPCMGAPITKMRMTPDENFLVVADDNGAVLFIELRERQERFQRLGPGQLTDLIQLESWGDEVLVTKADLDEGMNAITELRNKVKDLQLQNEMHLKFKEMSYAEQLKEVSDRCVQELDQAKNRLELLKEEYSDCEAEYNEKIRQMAEKHEHDVQDLETSFQTQIMALVDAYQQLLRDRDAQIERLEEQRKQLVLAHEKYVDELTRDFEQKLEEEHVAKQQLEDVRTNVYMSLEEEMRQTEEDIDTEIENLRHRYEERLTAQRELHLRSKGEHSIIKKNFEIASKEIEEKKDEIRQLREREKSLLEQIQLLEKEVTSHKKEIFQRKTSTDEKEKKTLIERKKNMELEKFKFVLDYKIRELKLQIEPRQLEIQGMRKQIKDMDEELERYHKSNSELDDVIGVLRGRIDLLQAEVRSKRLHATRQESAIERFRGDIQLSIAHVLSPDLLKEAVIRMVETHGATGTLKPRVDPDVQGEYNRHREFLRKSVKALQKSLEAGQTEHMETNGKVRQGNLDLIDEINKQKDRNKDLKRIIQAHVGRIRHAWQSQQNSRKNTLRAPSRDTFDDSLLSPDAGSSREGGYSAAEEAEKGEEQWGGVGAFVTSLTNHVGKEERLQDPTVILMNRRQRIALLKSAITELENRQFIAKTYYDKQNNKDQLPSIEGAKPTSPDGRPSSSGFVTQALPPISAGLDKSNVTFSQDVSVTNKNL
jgi:WD40 repeat protein/chromosome segregation ATPase